MSAVSGQRLAQLTKSVLESIRNNDSFSAFYSVVLRKSKNHTISDQLLPRKRRAPARIEVGKGQPTFPETPKDHYRHIYFEAIDLIVNAIEQRFSQPSFAAYAKKVESLLLKGINGESYTAELDYMKVSYNDDIIEFRLPEGPTSSPASEVRWNALMMFSAKLRSYLKKNEA